MAVKSCCCCLSGIGIVVLLQRLPDQVDLMLLVSKAISDLISSIQLLLEAAMLGLGGVVLVAASCGAGRSSDACSGLWRSIPIGASALLAPPNLRGDADVVPVIAEGPTAHSRVTLTVTCCDRDHRNGVQIQGRSVFASAATEPAGLNCDLHGRKRRVSRSDHAQCPSASRMSSRQ